MRVPFINLQIPGPYVGLPSSCPAAPGCAEQYLPDFSILFPLRPANLQTPTGTFAFQVCVVYTRAPRSLSCVLQVSPVDNVNSKANSAYDRRGNAT